MPFSVSEVLIALRGDATGALRAIRETEASMGHLSETGKSTAATLAKIGATAAVALGVTFVAAAGKSIEMASNFQKQMALLQTEAGYSADQVKRLNDEVLRLAPLVGKSPEELAMGLYHIASNGVPAAQALDLLTASAKLSAIGNAGLEETTQAMLGVMAAYPEYLGHAEKATGMLNAIVGTGDMRMKQLTAAMATGLLPAAATAHIGLIDVGAALATLTDNVTPADEAATRLRMTLALLTHQSGPATDALATIGIKAGQLGTDMVKPDGLHVAISDLRDHLMKTFGPDSVGQTNKYLDILRKDGPDAADKYAKSVHGAAEVISISFGGGRTSAAIQTLLGEFDKFSSKYPQLRKNQNDFDHSWEVTKETFSFQMNAMKAGLDSLAIKFGTALLPLASQFLGWFTKEAMPVLQRFADWFIQNGVPALKKLADVMSTTLAPILHAFGMAIGFIKSHFDLFGPALAAVVVTMGMFKVAAMIDWIVNGLGVAIAKLTGTYVAETTAVEATAGSLAAIEALMTELIGVADTMAISLGSITAELGLYTTAATTAATATEALAASEGAATVAGAGIGAKAAAGAGAGVVGAGVAGGVAAGAEGAAGGGILAGIGAAGGGALAAIGGVLSSPAVVIAGVSFAVIEMYQHWDEFKKYISGSFMDAMHHVGDWFKEFAGYMSGSFKSAVGAVWTWIKDKWGDVTSGLHDAIQHLADFFGGNIDRIKHFFEGIPQWAGDQLGKVGKFFQDLPNRIIFAFGFLVGWWARFWHDLPGHAADAARKVLQWFKDLPGHIWDGVTAGAQKIKDLGAWVIGKVKDGLVDAFWDVVNWFRDLPQHTADAGKEQGGKAKDFGGWLIGRIKDGIVDAAKDVFQWFKDLPGHIWDLINEIGPKLKDFGSWLIGKIVEGIEATPGAIWDAIKNVAGAAGKFLSDIMGGISGAASSLTHGAQAGYNAGGVPSRQLGGPINRTGLYLLHAGEHVLNPMQTAVMRSGSGSGGGIGQVNVYNPTSNVDVVTAISQQRWLERMSRRGIGAPASWPLTMAGA